MDAPTSEITEPNPAMSAASSGKRASRHRCQTICLRDAPRPSSCCLRRGSSASNAAAVRPVTTGAAMTVCAMMMAMMVEHFREIGHASLGSPGVDELRWLKPVFPGDTLRCQTEVIEKSPSRSKPEIGSFRSRMTVFNQDDVPVMTFTSIGLVKRRPAKSD